MLRQSSPYQPGIVSNAPARASVASRAFIDSSSFEKHRSVPKSILALLEQLDNVHEKWF